MSYHRGVIVGVLLVFMSVALMACSGQRNGEVDKSAQPTLNWTEIPMFWLAATPVPGVPLANDDPRFPIAPASGEALRRGRQLYEMHCASCHGINGEGQIPDPLAPGMAPPHNNDGHTWHHPDQVNFSTAWLGRTIAGTMPSFRDKLSPDELILILAYIKTWWNEDSLAVQLDRTRATARQ